MNNTILLGFASVVALVGTTVYWRRRARAIKESLTVSREWEANTNTAVQNRNELRAAQQAAQLLDGRVTELPERVEAVDRERRDLRRELDSVRERWADAWWETNAISETAHFVAFDRWELPDARAFAKRAMDEHCITVVVATGDDSFAVAVGDPLVDEFSATDIAAEITEHAGGGAGGTDRLATGGGATASLSDVCRSVTAELSRSNTARMVGVEDTDES